MIHEPTTETQAQAQARVDARRALAVRQAHRDATLAALIQTIRELRAATDEAVAAADRRTAMRRAGSAR